MVRRSYYALLVAGQPVSSLTPTLHDKPARFDDIGTDIAYQDNGYTTHLITHVLEFCREQGVERCFLDASADGRYIVNLVLSHFLTYFKLY